MKNLAIIKTHFAAIVIAPAVLVFVFFAIKVIVHLTQIGYINWAR